MILATISAAYASWRSARTALDSPDLYPNLNPKSGGISGPAPIAETPQSCAGLGLMLVKLEDLLSQQRLAWKKRQVKKAYSIEAAIRAQRLAIWRVERARREN